jgi:transcription initiation factor TFIID subunit 6
LAVEGVQPAVAQNPAPEQRGQDHLLSGGVGVGSGSSVGAGGAGSGGPDPESVAGRPQVKHIVSRELLLFFERVTAAVLDSANEAARAAAIASLRDDPGLHQLAPYFVSFVADKVTHNIDSTFVLTQMMHLTSALLENNTLFLEPYV